MLQCSSQQDYGTTISSMAQAIAQRMEHYACPYQDLFVQNNIFIVQACSKETHYASTQMATLWNSAADLCEDSSFGLKAADSLCPTSFYALDFSLYSSETLYELLQNNEGRY